MWPVTGRSTTTGEPRSEPRDGTGHWTWPLGANQAPSYRHRSAGLCMPPDATRTLTPPFHTSTLPHHPSLLSTLSSSPSLHRHSQCTRTHGPTPVSPFHRSTAPRTDGTTPHAPPGKHRTRHEPASLRHGVRPWHSDAPHLTHSLALSLSVTHISGIQQGPQRSQQRHGIGARRARPARPAQRRQVGVVLFFVVAARTPTVGALCSPQWRLAFKGSVAVKR